VLAANCGQNPARQTSILAGIPESVPAFTINKVCGSGLKSVHLGAQSIALGEAQVVVCGGQECMSQAPHAEDGAKSRRGQKMGAITFKDTMINDGLTCAFNNYHMGITAENVAEKYGISREDQDAFAAKSQEKAVAAAKNGSFAQQIVPIVTSIRSVLDHDEGIRAVTIEKLAKMKPAFKKDGTVTAGNASSLNDGAAFVILMSAKKAQEVGAHVLCKFKGFASAALDPKIMGMGPFPATTKCLASVKWKLEDVDLIESNEAFASQSLGVARELGLDMEKVNVNGGAISIGHPIGASGTRILVDLIYALKNRQLSKGIATMCIGGGMGVALAVEMAPAPKSRL